MRWALKSKQKWGDVSRRWEVGHFLGTVSRLGTVHMKEGGSHSKAGHSG